MSNRIDQWKSHCLPNAVHMCQGSVGEGWAVAGNAEGLSSPSVAALPTLDRATHFTRLNWKKSGRQRRGLVGWLLGLGS